MAVYVYTDSPGVGSTTSVTLNGRIGWLGETTNVTGVYFNVYSTTYGNQPTSTSTIYHPNGNPDSYAEQSVSRTFTAVRGVHYSYRLMTGSHGNAGGNAATFQLPNHYTVSYNGNGATSGTAPGSQTKIENTTLTLQSNSGNLAKAGAIFLGWNTNSSGTGTNYSESGSYTANAAVILYARWSTATYTVSYSGNGQTSGSAPSSQTKTHDVNLTLATNTGSLLKTGYTLGGWNTNSSGTGTTYSLGGTYTTNNSITLYAKWDPIAYSVSYNGNGATSGTAPGSQIKYYGVTLTLQANSGNLQKTGSLFLGWNTNSSGTGTNYSESGSYTANAAVILYARWSVITYPINYYGNGQTSGSAPSSQSKEHNVSLTLRTNTGGLGKTGYTLGGWNTNSSGTGTNYALGGTYTANASADLYAKWDLYIPPVPNTPTGFTVSNSNNHVGLSWNAVSDATGYKIMRRIDGVGTTTLNVGNVVSYNDTGSAAPSIGATSLNVSPTASNIYVTGSATTTDGLLYQYSVLAYSNSGDGLATSEQGGRRVAGALSYTLRAGNSTGPTLVVSHPYTDTNNPPTATNPTAFFIDNVQSTSLRLNWSGAAAASGLRRYYSLTIAAAGCNSVTLTGDAVRPGAISGYSLERKEGLGSYSVYNTISTTGSSGTYSDSPLTVSETYCYKIYTQVPGAIQNSTVLEACQTMPVAVSIPTITSSAATSIGLTVATLNGTVSHAGNGSVVPSFDYGSTVSFGTGVSASPTPITVNGTNFSANTESNLSYNTLYYFRAKGINSAGTGYSGTPHLSFVTKAGQATAPSHSETAYRNQNLQVSWNSSGLSGSKYDLQIQYRDDTLTWLAWQDAVANILAFEVNVLMTTQSTYNQVRFRIRAYNSNNVITEGLESTPATLQTIVIPTVSTSAQQVGDSTTSTVTFRGNLSNLGGASQVSTSFQYSYESDFGYGLSTGLVNTGSIGTFNRTLDQLSQNYKVNYRAHASNTAGSATGSGMSIYTLAAKPEPPYYQSQAAYGSNITVFWTNVSSATKYKLYRQYGTSSTWLSWIDLGEVVSGTSFAVTNDTNNTRIRFKVSALNRVDQENTSEDGLQSDLVAESAPTMQTNSASSVLSTSATLSGTVLDIGGSGLQVTSSFEYGTTLSYGSVSGTTLISTNGATYSHTIPTSGSLLSNQQYNFRAKGVNTVGTSYGANNTFVTKAAAATNITITGSIISEQIIGISWTDPGSNSAKDYRLVANYYDPNQGDWTLLSYSSYTTGTSLTYTLLSNTTYSKVRFAINTRNSLDETTSSGWDNINGHTLGSLITPLRPTNVTYIINGLDVTINFTKGTNATSTALYLTGSPTTIPALPISTTGSSISFSFPLLESNYNTLHTGHLESYYEDHNTVSDPDTAVSFTTGKIPQTAPNAPTIASFTSSLITLTAPSVCGPGGCEYKHESSDWQSSLSFNVSADTPYVFYARKKSTTTYEASPSSTGTSIRSRRVAPVKPWIETAELTNVSAVIRSSNDSNVISNGQDKPQGSSWTGLTAGTDYMAMAYYPIVISPAKPISDYSEELLYTTRLNPPTPTIYSITHNTIVLDPLAGCEFRRGTEPWQANLTFSGLNALSAYQFQSRYTDSPGSLSAYTPDIRTLPSPPIGPIVSGISGLNVTITWTDSMPVGIQWSHSESFNTFTSINYGVQTLTFAAANYNMTGTIYIRSYSTTYSLASVALPVSYTIPKGEQTAPATPTISDIQPFAITLTPFAPTSDYEYSMDLGAWQDSNTFTLLDPNSGHSFRARKKSNTYYNASPASPATATVYTLSGAPTKPAHITQAYYSETISISWTNGLGAIGTKLLYSYYDNSVWTTFTPVTGSGYHSSPYQFTITNNTIYKKLRFRADSFNTSLVANSSLVSDELNINVAPLPVFVTSDAQNITDVSATLTGVVTDIGASAVQEAFFKYGLATPGNLNSISTLNIVSAPTYIQQNVTILNRNALYYFALTGYNNQGSAEGTYETFRTLAGAPSVPTHLLKAGWNKPLVVTWTNGLSATSHLVQIQYFDTTDPNPSFHGWTVFNVGVALASGGSITIANNNKYTQARIRVVSLNTTGAQNIGPIGETIQLGGRPELFNWSVPKMPGGQAVVTAEEWNRLIDHIQAMWIYVGVTPTHTMTRPVQNQTGFTALIANQIINGINFMFDAGNRLPNVVKGDPVNSSWFISIITKLDSIT